jgi:hypothetical protein
MLDIDQAQKALKFLFPSLTVGSPQPFVRAYDNVNGGEASIDNFNELLRPETVYPVSGSFGVPDSSALNLRSDYPIEDSIWVATSYVVVTDSQSRWTGTAVAADDVEIIVTRVNPFTKTFAGALNGVSPIEGTIVSLSPNNEIETGTLTANVLSYIFYGNITYTLFNETDGPTDNQIFCSGFFDLTEQAEFISLNALKSFLGLGNESEQGNAEGLLIQNIFFAAKCSISLDGFLFPLTPLIAETDPLFPTT